MVRDRFLPRPPLQGVACGAAGPSAIGTWTVSSEPAGEPVVLSFVEDGEEVAVTAAVGQTLLEVAHENDIDLEGACDGSLACSTCHVVLEQEYFDMLPEPEEEEEDMLDLAFGLTDTSRLGCQIKLTKELEGIRATIPGGADNMLPPKG